MIRFRPMLVPTLWCAAMFAVFIGLGVWQVQRLHWKLDLIDKVETRMKAPAEDVSAALAGGADRAEWRHVRARGHFENDKELYLFAMGPDEAHGVQVIAPFDLAAGGTILINRGFVPEEKKDPAARPESLITDDTEVTGVLRLGSKPGLFTPAPDVKTRLFYSKDAGAMAAAIGVRLAAPIFIEADAGEGAGLPIGGQTIVDFPNNHLQYALTWFGLAFALLVFYFVYHRSKGRLSF